MLLAKHFLSKKLYQLALRKNIKTILYNETDFVLPKTKDITFFNCTTQRVPSTWFTWKKNEEVLLSFKSKFPKLLLWGSYDLTLAFLKALYWSNQKTGFLHYSKETFFQKEKAYIIDPLYPYNRSKVILKYVSQKLSNTNKSNFIYKSSNYKNKNAIYIKNGFQLTLYKHLLQRISNLDDFVVFVSEISLLEDLKKNGIKKESICFIQKSNKHVQLPFINVLKFNKGDWFVFNQILASWNEIAEWVSIAEQIGRTKVKSVLMNEAENGIFGGVMGEVLNKFGVVTYNTMNGLKSGQAQDSFINFDYWFVWDEQMKKMLVEKNGLYSEKLIISGHLMEDEIGEHIYQNSLGLEESLWKGKKVISLFSVRGRREEKIETFKKLYTIAEESPDIFILIRPHPSEREEEFIYHDKHLSNVKWIRYTHENLKTSLYDQLSISSLSICFGSTVAIESKWFGVPCISIEMRKESLIYAIDQKMIIKTDRFDNQLFFELLKNDKYLTGLENKESIADSIIKTLRQ